MKIVFEKELDKKGRIVGHNALLVEGNGSIIHRLGPYSRRQTALRGMERFVDRVIDAWEEYTGSS